MLLGYAAASASGLLVDYVRLDVMLELPQVVAYGVAMGLAVFTMQIFSVIHPPAGAMPILILQTQPDVVPLFLSVIAASMAMLSMAYVYRAVNDY